MALFKFDIDALTLDTELYSVNFPISLNTILNANKKHFFKDFDNYLLGTVETGRIRGKWDVIPVGNNQYLFNTSLFSAAQFNFFTDALGGADSIAVKLERVDVTDFDAGTYTVLDNPESATLTLSTIATTFNTTNVGNGVLISFTPAVYAGTLKMFAFFFSVTPQTSGAVLTKKIILTSAEILNGFAAPIVLVAGITGKVVQPLSAFFYYKRGAVDYVHLGGSQLQYSNDTLQTPFVTTFTPVGGAGNHFGGMKPVEFDTTQDYFGKDLKFKFLTANPTLGDGVMNVYLTYTLTPV